MIVTQARQVGLTCTFMGADGWGGVKDYASAADLEGCVYCSAYAPGTTDAVKTFEENYKTEFKADVPNMFAPLGYDAAKLLCAAIEAAEKDGKEAGTDAYSEAVIAALKATNGLSGVTSDSYSFDQYNNPVKAAAIIELKAGQEVFKEMY
jgi:branched-chain amino acid transport system substrate-binding protein